MSDDNDFVIGFWSGFGLMTVIIFFILLHVRDVAWTEKNIVKHTDAYFHPDTGEFTWPDKEQKNER